MHPGASPPKGLRYNERADALFASSAVTVRSDAEQPPNIPPELAHAVPGGSRKALLGICRPGSVEINGLAVAAPRVLNMRCGAGKLAR